jgi:hypothetical protein
MPESYGYFQDKSVKKAFVFGSYVKNSEKDLQAYIEFEYILLDISVCFFTSTKIILA